MIEHMTIDMVTHVKDSRAGAGLANRILKIGLAIHDCVPSAACIAMLGQVATCHSPICFIDLTRQPKVRRIFSLRR